MSAFHPGLVLCDRFEVVRRLGAGGLAEVFQARDGVSGQEVALKVLHDHLAQDEALAARFRREMALTRSLDHAAIVRVFDLHEHAGRPFFSMELLRGQTLSARLREGPLPAEEARRIARTPCEALRVAHRAGIVHRDLKPQNIFLTEDGAVKLLDFGMARVAGQARLTAQSMVMGTPGYIAPELLSGAAADARADVYSLGATLFEMLTGRHAFAGNDPYAVLRLQREGPPAATGLEKGDAQLLRRMLQPDAERRFLDVEQVLRALGGELVPAAPEPLPSLRAGKFDVIVHHKGMGEGARLAAVAARLGGRRPARGWRARLTIDGKNRLVAGADRETADGVAEICKEQGLPTTVVSSASRWRPVEWLARRCGWIGTALGAVAPTLLLLSRPSAGPALWRVLLSYPEPRRTMELIEAAQILGLLFALVFVPVAGLLMLGAAPPLKDLAPGDPALNRLVQNIGRRVARLRERAGKLPAAQRILMGELLREAVESETLAVSLAAQARTETGDDPEGPTLPHGTARDRTASRLLEIAAALDDALEVAQQPAPDRAAASGALSRLREEIEFARKALPEAEPE